ncbi:hypothetical protein [Limnohabitans sp. WS1]|uniref:hypothetical protein n=1 Tax=Limnohabitans sp. WS1 TaxID=1100726 RepID=UPI000D3715F9|nr:hypothetical protein [Limnohabitans sp. WS1]PUE20359.1 hypothetical protein B9Z48_05450 [Limnohabitans sp. WS1]
MSLSPEDLKTIIAAMPQTQPAVGAISVQGINKYWPQIIGAVALGWFLVGQGKEQQALVGRVQSIEKSVESINQVKAEQALTSGEVRELKIAVGSINAAIKDMGGKFDVMAGDMRAVSQQVSAISQSLRGRQ